MKKIFVTGIGTDVGKTIVAAIIAEALQADYWKPVQAGLDYTDVETVKRLVSNKNTVIHPEAYRLKMPASPHAAAAAEGISIQVKNIKIPDTLNTLVIEGAGGLMVPLNEKELVIDMIEAFGASIIVVIRHYLGSINHSLLTLQALKQRNIPVMGIVISGTPNEQSEKAILAFSDYKIVGRIGEEKEFTPSVISRYAEEFNGTLVTLI
ncbi:MAG TPA: dethiobiotin synthase [Bacteroidia bacterium]|jgi:dethiobiotin synthetase|nr:dethiobiotin synthase [Bacteroidia bacterium]